MTNQLEQTCIHRAFSHESLCRQYSWCVPLLTHHVHESLAAHLVQQVRCWSWSRPPAGRSLQSGLRSPTSEILSLLVQAPYVSLHFVAFDDVSAGKKQVTTGPRKTWQFNSFCGGSLWLGMCNVSAVAESGHC